MFTHVSELINPVELTTTEGPSGRYYCTPEGLYYPSVTTVLGATADKQWLTEWRESMGEEKAAAEMERAATRGTAVHLMAERFLNNEADPTRDQLKEHVLEFNTLRLYLKRINNIITQETALWSDVLQMAGRVDCVGEYKGTLSIVDFKTSTSSKTEHMIQDYWLQTTAYAIMFQERYGIQIDNAVIIMSVERGAVPLVFQKSIEPFIPQLVERVQQFHAR